MLKLLKLELELELGLYRLAYIKHYRAIISNCSKGFGVHYSLSDFKWQSSSIKLAMNAYRYYAGASVTFVSRVPSTVTGSPIPSVICRQDRSESLDHMSPPSHRTAIICHHRRTVYLPHIPLPSHRVGFGMRRHRRTALLCCDLPSPAHRAARSLARGVRSIRHARLTSEHITRCY